MSPNRFRIVVGYDFSPQAELALERALGLACGFAEAEIHVAAALGGNATNPDFPSVEKNMKGVEIIRDRLASIIEARLAVLQPPSVHTFIHVLLHAGPDTILGIAAETEADMIIVGTHSKRGFVRAVLGSVSEKIVREALCPVLVVRETTWEHQDKAYIEPPCKNCIKTRATTAGASWWCEFHDHAPPYASPLRSHVQHNPEESRRIAWPMI